MVIQVNIYTIVLTTLHQLVTLYAPADSNDMYQVQLKVIIVHMNKNDMHSNEASRGRSSSPSSAGIAYK